MQYKSTAIVSAIAMTLAITFAAHATTLRVTFDREGTQNMLPHISDFVPFEVFLVADGPVELEAWRAGLSTGSPDLALISLEALGSSTDIGTHLGDYDVQLDSCATTSGVLPLLRAVFMDVVPGELSEVSFCPQGPSSTTPPTFRNCGAPNYVAFEDLHGRECGLAGPICAPEDEIRIAVGHQLANRETIVRVPINLDYHIVRGTEGCPPILICRFCGPHAAKWQLSWDKTKLAYAGFEVDPSVADLGHGLSTTENSGGMLLHEFPTTVGFASVRAGTLGTLLLQVPADAPLGTIPVSAEWTWTEGDSPVKTNLVATAGSVEVTDAVPVEKSSFGALKARWE